METALIEAIHAINFLIEENKRLKRELDAMSEKGCHPTHTCLTATVPITGPNASGGNTTAVIGGATNV